MLDAGSCTADFGAATLSQLPGASASAYVRRGGVKVVSQADEDERGASTLLTASGPSGVLWSRTLPELGRLTAADDSLTFCMATGAHARCLDRAGAVLVDKEAEDALQVDGGGVGVPLQRNGPPVWTQP